MTQQLLVSVRTAAEAEAALTGGCDILDIKEPRNGSLGMAPVEEMARIVEAAAAFSTDQLPISAALGEVVDWSTKTPPALPSGITYVKLGTAELGADPAWVSRWLETRRRFEEASGRTFQWIAVTYADWRRANSPVQNEVIQAARETGCDGVLFDTYIKDGSGLLEWLTPEELRSMTAEIQDSGQFTALAGQIRESDLDELAAIDAAILAVRSAVCLQGERTDAIEASAVRRFRRAMDEACEAFNRPTLVNQSGE